MYLLKRGMVWISLSMIQKFTFHHVSIKTRLIGNIEYLLHDSHSTMYLLKLFGSFSGFQSSLNSHSTMYLLKLASLWNEISSSVKFTFHHVSIKTLASFVMNLLVFLFTFHHVSIKTDPDSKDTWKNQKFTFHHVSIKTGRGKGWSGCILHSHSTMYLLKRNRILSPCSRTYIHIPPCIY